MEDIAQTYFLIVQSCGVFPCLERTFTSVARSEAGAKTLPGPQGQRTHAECNGSLGGVDGLANLANRLPRKVANATTSLPSSRTDE
jgi:hypothetical protein